MSAVMASRVEGISARYAAQIQELLYVQAVKRMVAEQEAARVQAEAQRTDVLESMRSQIVDDEPVKVDPETAERAEAAEPIKIEMKEPASVVVEPAQLIDIHA